MANRSTFPEQIDSFVELFDLPPSKVAQAKRFQELKMKPTLNATEQTELNNLVISLGNYIITPETWNKFADALVNVETFFTQEVMEFIEAKQALWATYVNDFVHKGVYNTSTQYKFQNMVTYNGDLYLCTKDAKGIVPTNTANWQKISTKGDKGDVGLNTHYRGLYGATTAYVMGDAVSYNGNIFYCAKDTTAGTAPTNATYWFLFDKTIVSATAPTTPQQGLLWIELLD
ncbi:hypothetical protein [Bacillus gaemokensis]|uniref:Uncharacterized protein n=1 Tax=Bacillus gaemokensis TaxID=574375 RepID=A0A073KBL8_9BACI|nr:hypothetical protein [Bacillus gaemokensis]KEK23935.1 hypothetical protein BAGA_05820 [Bacillus gaemokensis]KYG38058.1 hypothetical protein AZF08_20065 [Bacillus gaemokensis]